MIIRSPESEVKILVELEIEQENYRQKYGCGIEKERRLCFDNPKSYDL